MTQNVVGKALKAAYSGAMACLGSLAVVLVGNTHFSDLTDGQWVTIGCFTLGAIGGTYGLAGWAGPTIPSSGPSSSGPHG